MNKIIIFGSGGHAVSCIDVINSTNKYHINYLVDKNNNGYLLKNKVINEKFFFTKNIINKYKNAHIGFGSYKLKSQRDFLFKKLTKLGYKFPKILSRHAIVSTNSKIGDGSIVMHNAVINSNVKIGSNCIINTSSIIEHDVIIRNNCHISTKAVVNGSCKIGEGTFVGSGAILINNITIGSNCIIGAGSVIKKNIAKNSIIKK